MTRVHLAFCSILMAAAFTVAAPAGATPIVSATGLPGADQTINFTEVPLAVGNVVTNQFAFLGVTFSPGLYYDTQYPTAFDGITGHRSGNFLAGDGSSINDPFSILFTRPVVAAQFGMATNPTITRLTARLGGVAIQSFQYASTYNNPATAYVGFQFLGQGFTFDEILVDVGGPSVDSVALIDSVQYIATPEPASVLLLGGGLAGLAARRRRRRA